MSARNNLQPQTDAMAIKTLDFQQFLSTDANVHTRFCTELCRTLSIYGFAKIRNTTLSNAVIDEVFGYVS
jgi:isopenicillin N synthase-like dioxygenase